MVLTSLFQEMNGQGVFTTPTNYGFACDEARFLCGSDLNGYSSSLTSSQSPGKQPKKFCLTSNGDGQGDPDNTQWFSFIADSPNIEIEISFSNCTGSIGGMQAGLYSNCIFDQDTLPTGSLVCEELSTVMGIISIIPDPLEIEIGQIYYMYLDGYAGSVCDFTISIVSGVCVENIPAPTECPQDCGVANVLFDNHGCTGFQETYSFDPLSQIIVDITGCNSFEANAELDSIIHVDWEITPTTGFTVLSTPMYYDSLDVRSVLTVDWALPGTYTIKPILSLNPRYASCRAMCECTDDVAYTVTIEETLRDTLVPIELCPNSTATADFCGETYNSTIDVTCKDRDNCTITVQKIIKLDRVDLPIDTNYFCTNDCFVFDINNVEYCDPNLYNIPSPTACDTFYQIQLIEIETDISFSVLDTMIDCTNTEAIMTCNYSTTYPHGVLIFWLNETGDTVSFTESYVTSMPGVYTFHVLPLDIPACAEVLSTTVIRDDQIASIALTPPSLDCNNPIDTIWLNTVDAISSASWTGPNGYASNDLSPSVVEGGTYSVEVIAANGCPTTETIVVPADFDTPEVDVIHDNLDCSEDISVAQYMSDSDIVSVEWSWAEGTSSEQIINLSSAGNYTLTVTASNGCTAAEVFSVVDNSYDPTLNINEDYIWRCYDTVRTIDLSNQFDPALSYEWTMIDGSSASTNEILVVDAPGIFILTSTDEDLGCIGSDTVRISADPNVFLDVEVMVNNPMCFEGSDGSIEITSFQGGEEPFVYFYGEETFMNVEDITFSAGMHTITITDAYDCMVATTFEVLNSDSIIIVTEPEVVVKYGRSGTLTADVSIDDDQISSIIWADASGNFLAMGKEVEIASDNETVIVVVEDLNGCSTSAEVNLIIDYEVDVFYPNVFSPNGDGTNDYFVLYSDGQPQSLDAIRIFDRAGELIYSQTNQDFNESQQGWNGEFNGKFVQPGVYVFMIQYTLGNGEQRNMNGTITVVR